MNTQSDLVLDMETFNFDDITDDSSSVPAGYDGTEQPAWLKEEIRKDYGGDDLDDEAFWDGEDDGELGQGDVTEEMKAYDDLLESAKVVSSNFEELPDDTNFVIGEENVSKGELMEVLSKRSEIAKNDKEFQDFATAMTEHNMQVESHMNMAMTEARIKFEHYTKLLNDADNLHPSDVQKALKLQKEAHKRYGELEKHANEFRRVEEQRQQEVDVMRIRRTDAELRGKVAGYRGINETLGPLMGWAQQQGIPQEGLMKAMSPALVQALLDAKEYREKVSGKKQAIAKATAPRANKGSSKAMASRAKVKNDTQARKNSRSSYDSAMRSGDMATAFNFLND